LVGRVTGPPGSVPPSDRVIFQWGASGMRLKYEFRPELLRGHRGSVGGAGDRTPGFGSTQRQGNFRNFQETSRDLGKSRRGCGCIALGCLPPRPVGKRPPPPGRLASAVGQAGSGRCSVPPQQKAPHPCGGGGLATVGSNGRGNRCSSDLLSGWVPFGGFTAGFDADTTPVGWAGRAPLVAVLPPARPGMSENCHSPGLPQRVAKARRPTVLPEREAPRLGGGGLVAC